MNTVSFFHGAALIRVIRYESFHSVEVCEKNDCSYLINGISGIYIKYSQKRLSPWSFTFSEDHVHEIEELNKLLSTLFIVLICGKDGICCLDWQEFATVVSTESTTYPKWISVSRMKGQKYSVWGRDGKLKHKIGNIDFPRKIFISKY